MPYAKKHRLLDGGSMHVDTVDNAQLVYGEIVVSKNNKWDIFNPPTDTASSTVLSIKNDGTLEWWRFRVQWKGGEDIPNSATDKFDMSVVWDTNTFRIRLRNDEDTPGPLKYYGTCNHNTRNDCNPNVPQGQKGWHPIPGSGQGATPAQHDLMKHHGWPCRHWHTDVEPCQTATNNEIIYSGNNKWRILPGAANTCMFLSYDAGSLAYRIIPLETKHIVNNQPCSLSLYNDVSTLQGQGRVAYYGTKRGADDGWHYMLITCDGSTPKDYCRTHTGECGQPGSPGNPWNPPPIPNDVCLGQTPSNWCDLFPGWPFHSPDCTEYDTEGDIDTDGIPIEWKKMCPGCCALVKAAAYGGNVDININSGCVNPCSCTNEIMKGSADNNVIIYKCKQNQSSPDNGRVICKGCCIWKKVDTTWVLIYGGCKRRGDIAYRTCTCDKPNQNIPGPVASTPCYDAPCRGAGAPGGGGGRQTDVGGKPLPTGAGAVHRISGNFFGLLHVYATTNNNQQATMFINSRPHEMNEMIPVYITGSACYGAWCDHINDSIARRQHGEPGFNMNESMEYIFGGGRNDPLLTYTYVLDDFYHRDCNGEASPSIFSGRIRGIGFKIDDNSNNVNHAHYYLMSLPVTVHVVK